VQISTFSSRKFKSRCEGRTELTMANMLGC